MFDFWQFLGGAWSTSNFDRCSTKTKPDFRENMMWFCYKYRCFFDDFKNGAFRKRWLFEVKRTSFWHPFGHPQTLQMLYKHMVFLSILPLDKDDHFERFWEPPKGPQSLQTSPQRVPGGWHSHGSLETQGITMLFWKFRFSRQDLQYPKHPETRPWIYIYIYR